MKNTLTMTAAAICLFASLGTAEAKFFTRVRVAWTKYQLKHRTTSLQLRAKYSPAKFLHGLSAAKLASQMGRTARALSAINRGADGRALAKKSGLTKLSEAYLKVNKKLRTQVKETFQASPPSVFFSGAWQDYTAAMSALEKQVVIP
ncbi:MAG: hypothetical protein JRH20_26835 [Deltaproteobacteria bacterium]|nr:hypothetical protein [Deltaproteobacteria bacterium]